MPARLLTEAELELMVILWDLSLTSWTEELFLIQV